jgi:hypothetical protein
MEQESVRSLRDAELHAKYGNDVNASLQRYRRAGEEFAEHDLRI